MNEITKVSDIKVSDISEYLGLPDTTIDDTNELNNYLNIAKNFISDYTAIPVAELDNHPTFVQVVFILVQDMYDTRTLYVDKTNINKVVGAILDGKRMNYVG